MPEIVFLDHSTANDQQYIENLQREGKEVRLHCLVFEQNHYEAFYRGTKEECWKEAKRNPPYDAILEFAIYQGRTNLKTIYYFDGNYDIALVERAEELSIF